MPDNIVGLVAGFVGALIALLGNKVYQKGKATDTNGANAALQAVGYVLCIVGVVIAFCGTNAIGGVTKSIGETLMVMLAIVLILDIVHRIQYALDGRPLARRKYFFDPNDDSGRFKMLLDGWTHADKQRKTVQKLLEDQGAEDVEFEHSSEDCSVTCSFATKRGMLTVQAILERNFGITMTKL